MGAIESRHSNPDAPWNELIMVHNVIRRNFRFIEKKAKDYAENEVDNSVPYFAEYAEIVGNLLSLHHHGEDHVWFPYLESKLGLDFSKLSEDHVQLHRLQDEYFELVKKLQTPNMEKVEAIIALESLSSNVASILSSILPHLQKEEEMTKETLTRLTDKEREELSSKMQKHTQEAKDIPKLFPLFLHSVTEEEKETNKHMFPWIVIKLFIGVAWKKQWKNHAAFYYNPPKNMKISKSKYHDE